MINSNFRNLISLEYVYFISNKHCCLFEKNKENLICEFALKELKNCQIFSITLLDKILLSFFLILLIFHSIAHLFIIHNIFNGLNKKQNIINILLNFLTNFYVFLLVLQTILDEIFEKQDKSNNIDNEYDSKLFKYNLKNVICTFSNTFYYFLSVFCLCANFMDFFKDYFINNPKIYFIYILPICTTIFSIIVQFHVKSSCLILIFHSNLHSVKYLLNI